MLMVGAGDREDHGEEEEEEQELVILDFSATPYSDMDV